MSTRKYIIKKPREEAKSISKGESKPHHIGKKSGAVLQQEFFSIINTKTAFRDKKYLQKAWDLKNSMTAQQFTEFSNKYQSVGLFPKDFSEIGK